MPATDFPRLPRLLLAALLFGAGMGEAADGATLRPYVTLSGPVVQLSDLFADLGATADRPLGPAPAPGNRIVVEAAQLTAIAEQFGVSWQASSSGDRAVLERPGAPLPRPLVLGQLRAALAEAGAPADADVELPDFSSPMVPADGSARPEVAQINFDAKSGGFTALLSVTASGIDPINMRLVGRIYPVAEAPVLTRRLPPGAIIGPGDVTLARVRASLLGNAQMLPAEQILGLTLVRPVAPGQPLTITDLRRPALIGHGQLVTMVLEANGIAVSAKGQALEPGGLGDQIRVLNPSSHAVVQGEVTGPGQVAVVAGSMSLAMPQPAFGGGSYAAASYYPDVSIPLAGGGSPVFNGGYGMVASR